MQRPRRKTLFTLLLVASAMFRVALRLIVQSISESEEVRTVVVRGEVRDFGDRGYSLLRVEASVKFRHDDGNQLYFSSRAEVLT